MDNLTHSLVGLAAAKAGLERWSPAATTLCVLAANAPDIDVLSVFGGRWASLHYHRGITHSIVGALALAILLPLIFYLVGLLVSRIRGNENRLKFRKLLLASLLVTATHPLMDWTNNYGLRPFLPWDGRWFYGDLVFIADPLIWLALAGATFLLTSRTWGQKTLWTLLWLVTSAGVILLPFRNPNIAIPLAVRVIWFIGLVSFIIARNTRIAERWGRAIPALALISIVIYWGALAALHARALQLAEAEASLLAVQNGEVLARVAAMPELGNPLKWRCVAETDRAVYRFDTSLGEINGNHAPLQRYPKPEGDAAILATRAAQDWRSKIFLDFARFPVARVEGDCMTEALVQFADIRFTEPGARGSFALEVRVECDTENGSGQGDR